MTITTSSVSETLHVYDNILQAIGKTPLIRLNSVSNHLPCPLYAKVELFNPGGKRRHGSKGAAGAVAVAFKVAGE
jgi:threonine dehydratase